MPPAASAAVAPKMNALTMMMLSQKQLAASKANAKALKHMPAEQDASAAAAEADAKAAVKADRHRRSSREHMQRKRAVKRAAKEAAAAE